MSLSETRNPSRLHVTSMTTPIFNARFHRIHQRLRMQVNIVFRPTNDELDLDRRTFALLYVGSDKKAFDAYIEAKILEDQEIREADSRLKNLQIQLEDAKEANDDYTSNLDPKFFIILQRLREEKRILSASPLKSKEKKRQIRAARRYAQHRASLNRILETYASQLPHPLKLEDAPDGGSIEEIANQVQHFTKKIEERIADLRKDKNLFLEMLSRYSLERFGFTFASSRLKIIQGLIFQGRCSIYELETFDEASNIQTDTEGLPIDFEMASPIKINMDVLRLAAEAESGTETIRERFHAFSAYPNGVLAGESKDGRLDLVFIPASVLNVILEFEEEWIRHVDEYILSTYASPAPVTGAEKQARQESFDRSDRNVPANTPNEPEQEDLPRFSLPEINGNSSNPPAHGNTTD